MSAPGSPLAYRPELNGVRAIAAWLLVIQHWTSWPLLDGAGSSLFFVLSGYLISGLIWKYEVYPGAPGQWGQRLSTFYKRRILRIIPPYYCLLALSALLPLETVRTYPLWFILPAANQLFYHLQRWGEGCGHLWTLAVDEQFYLLWPLLLGLVGQRRGWLLFIGMLGLLFRVVWSIWVTPGFVLVLLPASLELFAAGTLLRLLEKSDSLVRWTRGYAVVLAWAGWWLVRMLLTQVHQDGGQWWGIAFPTVGAVAAFLTLAWLLRHPAGARRVGMHNRLLLWMGKRSFGLYLYHLLLPVFYQRVVYHFWAADSGWREILLSPLPTVLVLSPLLIALSAASWHFIEAPLERVKKRLAYAPVPAAPAHS